MPSLVLASKLLIDPLVWAYGALTISAGALVWFVPGRSFR